MQSTKITLPTELDEIKLSQFMEYNSLSDDINDFERVLRAVSIFGGVSYRNTLKMPLNTLKIAGETIQSTLAKQPKFTPQFVFNGVRYGFVPNLDDLTTGEFIDIDTYCKHPKDLWKVMSVLYRPVTKRGVASTYEIEPYSGKVNEEFKEMPVGVALGGQVFFYTIGADLLSYTLRHLGSEEMSKLPLLNNNQSLQNMAGWDSSIYLLTEMYYELMRLQICPFKRPFCGPLTKRTLLKLNEKLLKDEQNYDNHDQ